MSQARTYQDACGACRCDRGPRSRVRASCGSWTGGTAVCGLVHGRGQHSLDLLRHRGRAGSDVKHGLPQPMGRVWPRVLPPHKKTRALTMVPGDCGGTTRTCVCACVWGGRRWVSHPACLPACLPCARVCDGRRRLAEREGVNEDSRRPGHYRPRIMRPWMLLARSAGCPAHPNNAASPPAQRTPAWGGGAIPSAPAIDRHGAERQARARSHQPEGTSSRLHEQGRGLAKARVACFRAQDQRGAWRARSGAAKGRGVRWLWAAAESDGAATVCVANGNGRGIG